MSDKKNRLKFTFSSILIYPKKENDDDDDDDDDNDNNNNNNDKSIKYTIMACTEEATRRLSGTSLTYSGGGGWIFGRNYLNQ